MSTNEIITWIFTILTVIIFPCFFILKRKIKKYLAGKNKDIFLEEFINFFDPNNQDLKINLFFKKNFKFITTNVYCKYCHKIMPILMNENYFKKLNISFVLEHSQFTLFSTKKINKIYIYSKYGHNAEMCDLLSNFLTPFYISHSFAAQNIKKMWNFWLFFKVWISILILPLLFIITHCILFVLSNFIKMNFYIDFINSYYFIIISFISSLIIIITFIFLIIWWLKIPVLNFLNFIWLEEYFLNKDYFKDKIKFWDNPMMYIPFLIINKISKFFLQKVILLKCLKIYKKIVLDKIHILKTNVKIYKKNDKPLNNILEMTYIDYIDSIMLIEKNNQLLSQINWMIQNKKFIKNKKNYGNILELFKHLKNGNYEMFLNFAKKISVNFEE